MELDTLGLLEEFTLDLAHRNNGKKSPLPKDVWDVEALLGGIVQEDEAMKTHTGRDVYVAPGAAELEEWFSLAYTHPCRYMFTDELGMRLKQDDITSES